MSPASLINYLNDFLCSMMSKMVVMIMMVILTSCWIPADRDIGSWKMEQRIASLHFSY